MNAPFSIIFDRSIPVREGEDSYVRILVADMTPLMEDEALLSTLTATLSPQRREKAEAIRNLHVRALSVGVAVLFDCLLREIGLRERDLRYTEGKHGKPEVEGNGSLHFNLSHSGHLAAAALTTASVNLGLDIQQATRYRPELVRRVFNEADRERLEACSDEADRQRLFTKLWCRAEAYAKATGEGLKWPFPLPPSEARFVDFPVGEDYCGSLCLISS